jgi:NADP-dependent aldehyde dehydrogenase
VAVFGASNFPLAFSVAGGDTASALCCRLPGDRPRGIRRTRGTGELVARALIEAVKSSGMPDGTFSFLPATIANLVPRWSAIHESRRSGSPAHAEAASR